jgi:hypothetical protein
MSTYQNYRQPPESASPMAAMAPAVSTAAVPPEPVATVPASIGAASGLQDPRPTQGSSSVGDTRSPSAGDRENYTADQWRVILLGSMERLKDTFGYLLYGIDEVESIDVFGFDHRTDTVVVHLSINGTNTAIARDVAWRASMSVGILWNPEAEMWDSSVWEGPGAEVVVSGVTYRCSSEVMTQMGQFLMTRSEWDQKCRVN